MRRLDRWLLPLPLPVQWVLITPLAVALAVLAAIVEGAKAALDTGVGMYAYLGETRLRTERAERYRLRRSGGSGDGDGE